MPERSQGAGAVPIGVPEGPRDKEFEAGWTVPIARNFANPGDAARYDYAFGDGWSHEFRLAAVEPRERGVKYPRCIGGERACPPEDCGGVRGYDRLLEVLADPRDEEREDRVAWLKGHTRTIFHTVPTHSIPPA